MRSSGPCSVPPETRDLVLADCSNVTFTENGLEPLRSLRSVQVSNVREVSVEKHAFRWNASSTGLVVLLTNTTVAHLPSFAFSGRIARVVFRSVYLGLIRAFAFSSITDTERLQFVDCNFANIEPQSFKKFSTNDFQIEGSRFHIIPSRFVLEVHVHNLFRLDSNFIDVARTLAFQVSHPTDTIISNNRVNVIEGEALSLQVRGRVAFQDNVFEAIEPAAFKGITIDRRTSFPILPELLFDNNTLGEFSESALIFNNAQFTVRFTHMRIDDTCSCDSLVRWRDILYPTKKNHPGPIEAQLTEIWCHEESRKETDFEFISGESFYENHCTKLISSIYFFVIIIVTTAVGLCVLIVVCILILRRRRQWDTVPTSEVRGVTPKPPDPKKGLVVPDGRVYRETEFHVIVEKAEPLDEVVPYRVTRDRSRTMFTRELPS